MSQRAARSALVALGIALMAAAHGIDVLVPALVVTLVIAVLVGGSVVVALGVVYLIDHAFDKDADRR